MNYVVANKTNCNKGSTHYFKKIQDQDKNQEIREFFYPFNMHKSKMTYPLWQCIFCKKIIEST